MNYVITQLTGNLVQLLPQMSDFNAKMYQIQLPAGLHPVPTGELIVLID